jgi:hypothetical protein
MKKKKLDDAELPHARGNADHHPPPLSELPPDVSLALSRSPLIVALVALPGGEFSFRGTIVAFYSVGSNTPQSVMTIFARGDWLWRTSTACTASTTAIPSITRPNATYFRFIQLIGRRVM